MISMANYTAHYFENYKVVILIDNCAPATISLTNSIEKVVDFEANEKGTNLWEWLIIEKDSMGNYDIVLKKTRYVSWKHLLAKDDANRMTLKKIAEYARSKHSI